MAELTKQRLIDLAHAKFDDAKLLLRAGSPGNAYYLAGYAVELLLKAVISSRFQADTLPDPSWSPRVFVHDVDRLLDLARLKEARDTAETADPQFGIRWEIVRGWSEASRYDSRYGSEAHNLIDAIGHPQHGVLQWLKSKL